MHGIISEESPFGKALLGAKEGRGRWMVEAPLRHHRTTPLRRSNTKEKRSMAEQKNNQAAARSRTSAEQTRRSAGKSWPVLQAEGQDPFEQHPF